MIDIYRLHLNSKPITKIQYKVFEYLNLLNVTCQKLAFSTNEQRRHTDCTNIFSIQNRFENENEKKTNIHI